jgi:hypothetical protein
MDPIPKTTKNKEINKKECFGLRNVGLNSILCERTMYSMVYIIAERAIAQESRALHSFTPGTVPDSEQHCVELKLV